METWDFASSRSPGYRSVLRELRRIDAQIHGAGTESTWRAWMTEHPHANPGGWLFVGHSESLNGLADGVEGVAPAVYKKI